MLTLSKNLTFSLAIVTMLVLGFAFAPVALAHEGVTHADGAGHGDKAGEHQHHGVVPEPDLSITDVSEASGNQLELYTAIDRTNVTEANVATQTLIDTNIITETAIAGRNIEFYIRLKKGYALLDGRGADATITGPHNDPATVPDQRPQLHISDLMIQFYDGNGAALATTIDNSASLIAHRNTAFPDGRNFKVTIAADDLTANARYMSVVLPGVPTPDVSFQQAEPGDVRTALIENKVLQWNKPSNALRFELVNAEPDAPNNAPNVVSIVRVIPTAAATASRFTEAAVSGPFDVRVTFTEQPKLVMDGGNIKIADLPFELENAKITAIFKGAPFYLAPPATEGEYTTANPPDAPPVPTGRDSRYHPYLLTITPNLETTDDVVIRVKAFDDLVKPPNRYVPPSNLASALNRSVLRVSVHPGAVKGTPAAVFEATDAYKNLKPQDHEYQIPGGTLIPKGGYLVIAQGDATQSGIQAVSADKYKDNDDRARADNQTDFNFMHNVIHGAVFPGQRGDLQAYFRNGATIRLLYQNATGRPAAKNKKKGTDSNDAAIAAGDVLISEIMWGRDESLGADGKKSQWIELHNTTDADISIDAKEWVLSFGTASNYTTEVDVVSNASTIWAQPGMSGATSITQNTPVPSELVSMSRMMGGPDGTLATSWAASMRPSSGNFIGLRVGTPGGANTYVMPETMEEEMDDEMEEEMMAPPATASDIMISEIMVASNDGRLPQWIEIANVSAAAVSLKGWSLEIENDAADATVVGAEIELSLGDVEIGAGQVALVISKSGVNSGIGTGEGDLRAGRIIDVQAQVSPDNARYSLISEMGFMISLIPPQMGAIKEPGDTIGNLGKGWDLPMSEGNRSSLIRSDKDTDAGTDAADWMLASGTSLNGAYRTTYYGDDEDVGTPGYDAGGPLPVELSSFYPKRNEETGHVEITWKTQSELNNAGFFIKRSQQRDGKFVVVNPTMIPGAGTTSEEQSYTYTDTTAQPNVVYYYQIEDVSLDGQRQTLTLGTRLRGHIGAAGKATTIWGELKSQE